MKTRTDIALRIFLWVIAVYHLVAGVAATFFHGTAIGIASLLFGVKIPMDSQASLLVRYLGAFGIIFGIMAVLAALAPGRHKGFIYGAEADFVVCASNRIAFAGLLADYAVGPFPKCIRHLRRLLRKATLRPTVQESPAAESLE